MEESATKKKIVAFSNFYLANHFHSQHPISRAGMGEVREKELERTSQRER